jgi:thiamine monophosphate kinase
VTLGRGAVDYALAKPGAVVALLPALGGAQIGLAIFRRPQPHRRVSQPMPQMSRPVPEPSQPIHTKGLTRAGGFLGLSDEPIFEDEQPQEKKGWWRRFWDE